MNSTVASAAAKSGGEEESLLAPPSSLLPVICGPTAAGKSEIALWLARRHNLTIISADSRQVYRGFDIGTSKPSRAELEAVPHHGIDVADPTERFSAAKWCELADSVIRTTHNAKRKTVVVGGTGFYISSLFQPLWEEPELNTAARAAVEAALAGESTEDLRRWCTVLDPARAHLGRAQLMRAVEIALLTGRRLSDLHKSNARRAKYTPHYLVVDPGLSLPSRIAARTAAMFDSGWVDEVRGLMKSVPADAPAWNASGYRTVRQHVEGAMDRKAAIDKIIIETRQYAKRQRTWFRNQLNDENVTRLAPNAPGWEDAVENWFERTQFGSQVTSHRSQL
jgi:tRNA dimethylallyltransferase